MGIKRSILRPVLTTRVGLMLLALGLSLAGFELTGLDLWVQDFFYDTTTERWLVDGNETVGRVLCYTGPKAAVWAIGLTVLTLALGPGCWRERWKLDQRGLWLGVAVLVTVPSLVGSAKSLTNCFCPSEIRRYGGDVAYATVCSPFPPNEKPTRRGHCFPAGHASGGFALMGLWAVRTTRRWRRGALVLGLGLGSWMGAYQMLKGAHFLSHTTTTLLVSWIMIGVWRRVLAISKHDELTGRVARG